MHIEENSALLNITRRFTEGNLIHSFIQAISIAPLQVHCTTQRRSRHNTDTVPEFHMRLRVMSYPKVPTWRLARDSN